MKTIVSLALALLVASASGGVHANFACNGGHPRCETKDYAYHQFANRDIGGWAGVSDLLRAGPKLSHYQTFLAELITERADTNAVAFWADGAARADKAQVWGGFMTARSSLPQGADAQLVGLEVDVLNYGLPGVAPNRSKVGIQVVGFGNVNTSAIEILHQHTHDDGRFMNGINIQPGAIHKEGTVIGVGPQDAAVGLNLYRSKFSDAAVVVSERAAVAFRKEGTPDARIWRDDINNGSLVLTAGPGGLRITNSANDVNLLAISDDGELLDSLVVRRYENLVHGLGGAIVVLIVMNLLLLALLWRRRASPA